jgi:general nucleoside transport system permease protein
MTQEQIAVFLGSSLRLSMPLILAGTGELVSERAGVLNMSLEGMMLMATFAGALGSWATGHPSVGLLCGVAAALLLALAQALLSVTLRANQLVVGIGFNILALGGTTFLYREIFGPLSREAIPGFAIWHLPVLGDLPILGVALFRQVGLVYVGLAVVVGIWALLEYTAFGLAVRAVGEDPRAADQAGVPVVLVRYTGVLVAGLMAGLAGVFISVGDIHTFTEGMTNGQGYLALAAVIFGGWSGWRTLAACLLFGTATALQFQLPAMGIEIPTAGLMMLPYVLALLAVGGLVGRFRAPAALTIPYERGT